MPTRTIHYNRAISEKGIKEEKSVERALLDREEDQILAETVLRHIREGSTQWEAFDEVARKLGRTPGACGFRWNAVVRKKEEENFLKAKKQRLVRHLHHRRTDTVDSLKQLIQILRRHEREFHSLVNHVHALGKQLEEKKGNMSELRKKTAG